MVVPLAVDLLGFWQESLDPFAKLDEGIPLVRLLDQAGDQLAHPVLELIEHHLPLCFTDALVDDLLGRLGRDPPEIVRGDVPAFDLALVWGEHLGIQLRLFGLPHLPGLGIDLGFLLGLCLGEQLLLEFVGEDQFEDPEITGLVVEVDPCVASGTRGLAVSRKECVGQGIHEGVGRDALFLLEVPYRVDDFLSHFAAPSFLFGTRLDRSISSWGISWTRSSRPSVMPVPLTSRMVPVNLRWPSIGLDVFTLA